jgi:hypothetical protein
LFIGCAAALAGTPRDLPATANVVAVNIDLRVAEYLMNDLRTPA